MRPIGTCVWSTRANPFLSAENLVDFQRFMGELDRAGREDHFWKMWGAVWEVCHLPIPDEVLTHLSCGGRQVPLRRFVCVAKVPMPHACVFCGTLVGTPGLAGVQEQSFCRVRGSSQGYHVSVGLQLWAVGLALAIMPGDLGVYAAESLSAASAPESAYTALGEMSRQRAGQWREQRGFLSDADFAYAFRSYEDAMAQAGPLVAEEWAAVRSSDSSELYGAVASALDAPAPSPRGSAPRRPTTFMMRMAGKGRLVRKAKAAAAEKPAVPREDQVEALTEVVHCLASMRPRSPMADRGRPFPPDSVDLDAFLFDGTESQLRWLVKAGQLDHDLSAYDFRGQPQREARQAAVAEPPMLAFLERQIEQLYNSQEPAVESDVGPLGVWLWCAAAGSPWQVQSAPVLSFYIPLPLWPRGTATALTSRSRGTLCLDGADRRDGLRSGGPCRRGRLQGLTSLSMGCRFRRRRQSALPRTGSLRSLVAPWLPSTLSGAWGRPMPRWPDGPRRTSLLWATGRIRHRRGNRAIPCHCGTVGLATPRRSGGLLNAVAGLLKYNTWDEIASKVLEAAERDGALGMDRSIQQDNHTMWQGQIRDDEVTPRFRLPSVVPLPGGIRETMACACCPGRKALQRTSLLESREVSDWPPASALSMILCLPEDWVITHLGTSR
eukprot:s887_g23.t1